MPDLPSGTVTFLFTDIEGSTALWERDREAMGGRSIGTWPSWVSAIAAHGGVHFKTDRRCHAGGLRRRADALAGAAFDGQRALLAEPWPDEIGPCVCAWRCMRRRPTAGRDYLAPPLNRLARTSGSGMAGRSSSPKRRGVSSRTTAAGCHPALPRRARLRGLQEPEEVFQVVAPGLHRDFPPLRSLPHHPTNLVATPTPLIGRDERWRRSRACWGRAKCGLSP